MLAAWLDLQLDHASAGTSGSGYWQLHFMQTMASGSAACSQLASWPRILETGEQTPRRTCWPHDSALCARCPWVVDSSEELALSATRIAELELAPG